MRYAKALPRVLVKSIVIRSVGYDENEWVLQVKYHNGKIYNYFRVPPKEFQALKDASSKGEYLNRQIKPYYEYEELEAAETAS